MAGGEEEALTFKLNQNLGSHLSNVTISLFFPFFVFWLVLLAWQYVSLSATSSVNPST